MVVVVNSMDAVVDTNDLLELMDLMVVVGVIEIVMEKMIVVSEIKE